MKKLKLYLIPMMLLGTSTFAADSLQESLTNGKFGGEVRFLYTKGSDSDAKAIGGLHNNANTASIVLELDYKTADFYGFSIGTALQTSYDFGIHKNDSYRNDAEDDSRNTITDTQLSQFYLQYSFLKSNLRVGRFNIQTPLIFGETGTFLMDDSFEGVDLTIKEVPKTLIKAMYINHWNSPYGNDKTPGFEANESDVDYDDGVYSLYLKNSSVKNLTLDTQYFKNNTDVDNTLDGPIFTSGKYSTYFVRGEYKLPTSTPLSLGIMHAGASFDKAVNGEDKTSVYGARVSSKIGNTKVALAYTKVDDARSFPGALGQVPDALLYTHTLLNKSFYAGVEAYSLQLMPYLGIDNLKTRIKFQYLSQSDKGALNAGQKQVDGTKTLELDLKYAFTKNFSMRSRTGYSDYKDDVLKAGGDEDKSLYTRLYLTYKF